MFSSCRPGKDAQGINTNMTKWVTLTSIIDMPKKNYKILIAVIEGLRIISYPARIGISVSCVVQTLQTNILKEHRS